ncbi:hypothetical protein Pst134EB_025175 [Puccinia striiformis f. sp. tritici]|nr:hypothetical protein Pst134EB_025175 [Puccinia striiformis f. sp. tritici]
MRLGHKSLSLRSRIGATPRPRQRRETLLSYESVQHSKKTSTRSFQFFVISQPAVVVIRSFPLSLASIDHPHKVKLFRATGDIYSQFPPLSVLTLLVPQVHRGYWLTWYHFGSAMHNVHLLHLRLKR